MAVVAYASAIVLVGNPPPVADATVAQAAIGAGTTVQLYGGIIDSADGTPTPSFAWQILEKAAGSTARFQDTGTASSTAQDPIVVGVDTWENIRVFLVGVNLDTAVSSEADIYKAPDTAFVQIRVVSTSQSLQKPAAGERNWMSPFRTAVAAIEALALAGAGAVLPAAVLQLINGGYATFGGNTQHKHTGPQVDAATNAVIGTVKLAQAPFDAAAPTVLNVEHLVYTATLGGTPTALGYSPGTVEPPIVIVGTKRAHALFYLKETITVTEFQVALSDGGSVAGAGYIFELFGGTAAQWALGVAASIGATAATSAATDNAPLLISKTGLNMSVLATWYIGLVCTQAPTVPGGSGTVTVTTKRSV